MQEMALEVTYLHEANMVLVGYPMYLINLREGVILHVPYGVLAVLDVCFHQRCSTGSFLSVSYQLPVLDVEESNAF